MKIFIDPGHGGGSTGAVYKGRKEQDDCLRLSLAVRDILLTQKDVEVMLSREDDSNPSITERCNMANRWGAGYFCSIHRNAIGENIARGVEAWERPSQWLKTSLTVSAKPFPSGTEALRRVRPHIPISV